MAQRQTFGMEDLVEQLKARAEEQASFDLMDYMGSVIILRGKGFSWRQVAEWHAKEGVKASTSSWRRVYQKFEKEVKELEEGGSHGD